MPTIYCLECDNPIELAAEIIATGILKVRCPACGTSGGYSSPSPSTGGGSPVPQSGGCAGFSYPELGLELVWIEAGTFQFGGKVRCTFSQGYWLGKYAVTQGEYQRITGKNPAHFKGSDRLPVESVSWDDAMAYCESLNRKHAKQLPSGYRFSLPTEAQWEYACRAGTNTKYSFGDAENQLGHYGWYDENSGCKTHPVGEKRPNPWGLYDMHGNVWEWCLDWYEDLPSGSVTDWLGPATGSYRVYRGGSWCYDARFCRSAFRFCYVPDFRICYLGFRLALSSVQ